MNWSRVSAYTMAADNGYKVCKFMVGDLAQYRASRGGVFIGSSQDSFEDAAAVCENNLAIMGEDLESEDGN